MEFRELLGKRYSVRAYQAKPVEDEKLHQVLEAARLAPTACNRQPFRIIVAHVAGKEAEFRKVFPQDWLVQAPLVLCVCGIRREAWVRTCDSFTTEVMDGSIAMTHIILAAANEGLGTCWLGSYNPKHVRKLFGIPDDVDPVAVTPLGYPAIEPHVKERKPLEQLVRYERW